jgi:hypothetical protein
MRTEYTVATPIQDTELYLEKQLIDFFAVRLKTAWEKGSLRQDFHIEITASHILAILTHSGREWATGDGTVRSDLLHARIQHFISLLKVSS